MKFFVVGKSQYINAKGDDKYIVNICYKATNVIGYQVAKCYCGADTYAGLDADAKTEYEYPVHFGEKYNVIRNYYFKKEDK